MKVLHREIRVFQKIVKLFYVKVINFSLTFKLILKAFLSFSFVYMYLNYDLEINV